MPWLARDLASNRSDALHRNNTVGMVSMRTLGRVSLLSNDVPASAGRPLRVRGAPVLACDVGFSHPAHRATPAGHHDRRRPYRRSAAGQARSDRRPTTTTTRMQRTSGRRKGARARRRPLPDSPMPCVLAPRLARPAHLAQDAHKKAFDLVRYALANELTRKPMKRDDAAKRGARRLLPLG
jgi:hypothetical protein